MTTITVPVWIFALSIGIPVVSLLWLLAVLVQKIRKPNKELLGNLAINGLNPQPSLNQQFHNNLLALQIDSIFHGMNAILEAERIKIRSLLNGSIPSNFSFASGHPTANPSTAPATKKSGPSAPKKEELSLEDQIANLSDNGNRPDDIAAEMGISQSEVELAMMMRSSSEAFQGKRLKAVA